MTAQDKPEAGKTYRLTGGPGAPSIHKGDTWAESEVPRCLSCGELFADHHAKIYGDNGETWHRDAENCRRLAPEPRDKSLRHFGSDRGLA